MNHEELAKGHVRRGHECGAPELSACGSDPDPVAQDTGNDGSLTDAQGNTDATSMDAKGARDASVDSSVQAALSDGQIVGVLATSDMAEISQGNLAQTQAMDTRVRTFGMDMVNMHSASSARMMILAMSIGAPAMESNLRGCGFGMFPTRMASITPAPQRQSSRATSRARDAQCVAA